MPTMLVLGPADHGRTLTREEFETARGQEGYRYELIQGKLHVSPAPNLPHDRLVEWLHGRLYAYIRRHRKVCNYLTSHPRVHLPESPEATQPEPDLALYQDFPLDLPIEQVQWTDVSPLVVVEVVSEDDPDKDLVRNVELYVQVPSIREYWIIDPRLAAAQPTLKVYRRRGQRWQNAIDVAGGASYTTRVLPGFRLTLDAQRA